MTEKLTALDVCEHLETEQDFADFMSHALETGDSAYIAHALGVIAKAKGMNQIADQTGISRKQLYRSFSTNGNPTLHTTLAVLNALGVELSAKAAEPPV